MENIFSEFSVIHQLDQKHILQLMELYKQTWWANQRSREEVDLMLKTSISFGLIQNKTEDLVGYARVLTDEIKYAFIFDVVVSDYLRCKGLGKFLMQNIMSHSRFGNVKCFDLTCAPEMVEFYEKLGFSEDYGAKAKPMRFQNIKK